MCFPLASDDSRAIRECRSPVAGEVWRHRHGMTPARSSIFVGKSTRRVCSELLSRMCLASGGRLGRKVGILSRGVYFYRVGSDSLILPRPSLELRQTLKMKSMLGGAEHELPRSRRRGFSAREDLYLEDGTVELATVRDRGERRVSCDDVHLGQSRALDRPYRRLCQAGDDIDALHAPRRFDPVPHQPGVPAAAGAHLVSRRAAGTARRGDVSAPRRTPRPLEARTCCRPSERLRG